MLCQFNSRQLPPISALVAAVALGAATPAVAQDNQPSSLPANVAPATGVQWRDAAPANVPPAAPAAPAVAQRYYAGEPPVAGPMQGGLPKDAWLAECARRLNDKPGMAVEAIASTCQHWWAFYQAGGAPHPTYGYAVPVTQVESGVDCPPDEEVIETTTRRIKIFKRAKRRIAPYKRVPLA